MRGLVAGFAPLVLAAQAPDFSPARVEAIFQGLSYRLLLRDGDRILDRGTLDAEARLLPCSTYKLPHALIALEAGVISLDRNTFTCDPAQCHSDHGTLGLESAIRQSCLSYFRQVARRLGVDREAAGMKALGYPGRGSLTPADAFWVDSPSFGITLREQLTWIHRFYTEDLGVKPAHLAAVRAATRRTEMPAWTLWGKTGSTGAHGGHPHGWFVGRVQWKDGRTSDVALLVTSPPEGRALGLEAQARLEQLLGR